MSLKLSERIALNRRAAYLLLYAILAFVAIYVMTSGGMGVSFDSERYLTTAYHLKQGDVEKALERAFPHSPMFYPLAIASIPSIGADRGLGAARLVSILSLVVSVVMVFLLGLKIQGDITAHLSALSMLFLSPVLYAFCYCWSETLYVVLSLLFLLALTSLLKAPEGRSMRHLIACGVFAGLALVTRFIGLSLIGTGILAILFLSNPERSSRKTKKLLTFVSVSLFPLMLNLLLAFSYLGTIARESAPSGPSILGQLVGFFVTIYRDFLSFDLGFQKYVFFFAGLVPEDRLVSPWFWLGIAVLLCLGAFMVFSAKLLLSSRSFRQSVKPQLALLMYIASYGLLLVVITSLTRLDPMGSRFTMPLYPPILLLAISLTIHVVSRLDHRRQKKSLSAAVVLGLLFFWGVQLISTSSIYKGISTGSFPAMEHPGNRNRASLKFLQENADSKDLIVTNVRPKLFFIWPRQAPYLANPGSELRPHLGLLSRESHRRSGSVYVLICTQDYSQTAITDIESINEATGFFPWKKVFGNDLIYKADFSAAESESGSER